MRTANWLGFSLLLSLFVVFFPVVLNGEDLDRDGIDEMLEEMLARSFLPMIWYSGIESCPEPGVILFHVRPFVPGGSPDTLSITYCFAYYEDCGVNGHSFDLETFAITLYPLDNSQFGYGVHSIKTWAHRGTICEEAEERTYDPLRANVETFGDTLYSSWENVHVSGEKHAFFLNESTCNGHCFGTDICSRDFLMNDGRLVPSVQGQYFDFFNIGEINDHLIENFLYINSNGGFSFNTRNVWGTGWMDENYHLTSPGPPLPVYFSVTTLPYPNPIRPCKDNSIGLDLWYRSLIRVQVFDVPGGELMRDQFLGEYCRDGNDLRLHLWDGYDNMGNCLDDWQKIAKITAYRGGNVYDLSVGFDIDGQPVIKPEKPSNLDLTLIDDHVLISWMDNANNEDWYFVERRAGTCAFAYLATVPGNPGIGIVEYEDHNISVNETYSYRVFASGDGGFSGTTGNHTVTIPECSANPFTIINGPTLNGDSIYSTRMYSAVVEISDPNCTFTQFDWRVSGNDFTDPGSIIGSGDSVWYYAPDIECENENAPAFENKIDVAVTYQGDSDSASTGWFFIQCPPSDTSGCPYLYVWDGEGFIAENNLLPLSEITRESSVDYYQLRTQPAPSQGYYILEIREHDKEYSYLDEIELLFADHSPLSKIGVTQDGKIFEYKKITPPVNAIDSEGNNILEALLDIDGIALQGNIGNDVSVSFNEPGQGVITIMTFPVRRRKSVGPIIIPDENGNRTDQKDHIVGIGLPRHQGGLQFFSIPSTLDNDADLDLTVEWIGDQHVDHIGMVSNDLKLLKSRKLILEEGIHSSAGDVTARLLRLDDNHAELRSGERIRLLFTAPDQPEDMERDFILVSRGYYLK
jgi:hypothetical protein